MVVPHIQGRLSEMGLQLGLTQGVIEAIMADPSGQQWTKLFAEWKEKAVKPYTWASLLSALESPEVKCGQQAQALRTSIVGLATKERASSVSKTTEVDGPTADVSKTTEMDVSKTTEVDGPTADVSMTTEMDGPTADVSKTTEVDGPTADVSKTTEMDVSKTTEMDVSKTTEVDPSPTADEPPSTAANVQ